MALIGSCCTGFSQDLNLLYSYTLCNYMYIYIYDDDYDKLAS